MAVAPTLRGELRALAVRSLGRGLSRRAFHGRRPLLAAHNFTMPAMSPTMTEGNISTWKVKEGDAYSAGDVLLEIETDKASMDVEAQEDGIMAKIIAPDGSKGLQVGTRIAVLADAGDDVSSLEMPADEAPATPPKPQQDVPRGQAEAAALPSEESTSQPARKPQKPPGKAQKQSYPLYPSVIQLFHIHGLDPSEADKIPVSGPGGRLLKGDVLAYLGSIEASAPSKISQQLEHRSHLDLSNIKLATPPPEAKAEKAAAPEEKAPVEADTRISLSISFAAIRQVQKRVYESLGIDVPLETFIARAIDISNTNLPAAKSRTPSADELFDDIIGVHRMSEAATVGHFLPQISAIGPTSTTSAPRQRKSPDIIDILTGAVPQPAARAQLGRTAVTESTASSVFALTVPKEEEERAKIFLQRMKTVLQIEPGRLVL